MADRVVVMNKGVIEQVGTPSEIYETPVNRFVLGFVGYTNFLRMEALPTTGWAPRGRTVGADCPLRSRAIDPSPATVPAAPRSRMQPGARVDSRAGAAPRALVNRVPGTLRGVAYEGAMLTLRRRAGRRPALARARAECRASRAPAPGIGGRREIAWHPADAVRMH